ncbi:MAG: dual specificity protein phosphatase family protein [Candidatus Heimdallarchaeota archaeon]|nr:MAG: dual specificity protein phosphatase family protein [Candidatus Heimdallarchaeota archaeon]
MPPLKINWIIPGKLAGSAFPLSNEVLSLPKLNLMLIVNLTSHGLPNTLKEQLKDKGVEISRFPIPDFSIPTPNVIHQYLQTVCETLRQDQAVLTHCIAGCGRTGTMTGLFLVTHDYSPEKALEIIHESLGEGCPDTKQQASLLHQYRRKCPNYSQCKGKF